MARDTQHTTDTTYYLGAYPQRTEAGTIVYGTLLGPWDDIRDAFDAYDDELGAETELSRQGLTVLKARGAELIPAPPEDWPARDDGDAIPWDAYDWITVRGDWDATDVLHDLGLSPLSSVTAVAAAIRRAARQDSQYVSVLVDVEEGALQLLTEALVSWIEGWDCQDVEELRDALEALRGVLEDEDQGRRLGDVVDLTDLPSAPMPDWVRTDWPVWARDEQGRYLVGADLDEVVSEDELRELMED